MKKITLFALTMMLATSCDDGDLVFESLNFEEVSMQKCEDKELYYKVNDKELLVVNLTSTTGEPLINDNLQIGDELEVLTSTTNQIIYRLYDSSLSNQNVLCADVPPANPQVVDEYVSENNGSIMIYKQLQVNESESQNNQFTVAYNFSILFKNIVLTSGEQQIKYPDYTFGTYQAESYTLNFNQFDQDEINSCNNNQFYLETSDKVMQLQITETLPTAVGESIVNLSENQFVKVKINQGILEQIEDYQACDFDNDDLFFDVWTANEGTIKVTTREVDIAGNTQLVHDFELVNVVFENYDKSMIISYLSVGTLAN